MIHGNFLTPEQRRDLTILARKPKVEHRVARRANALVLLDRGMSCEEVAAVLLLDDDTVRGWYSRFEQTGVKGISDFKGGGSAGQLTEAQMAELKAWVTETLPHSTRMIGAWIEKTFGIVYETRGGLIKLLNRLGLEHRKPQTISRKLSPAKQAAFIAAYEALLNSLEADEAVLFVDAVHPTHGVRPVGCWAPKEIKLAVEQTSGRDRLNIHGAIDLETGQTRMIDVLTVDAVSTIALLASIEAMYPAMRLIHVFLDNARYHHAQMVREWLGQPGRRIVLHFVPTYCPHLNPIERLWGAMHKAVTHNQCYATYWGFCQAVLGFLRDDVPAQWHALRDSVTDNFRVIDPAKFRVVA
jgi:transposase